MKNLLVMILFLFFFDSTIVAANPFGRGAKGGMYGPGIGVGSGQMGMTGGGIAKEDVDYFDKQSVIKNGTLVITGVLNLNQPISNDELFSIIDPHGTLNSEDRGILLEEVTNNFLGPSLYVKSNGELSESKENHSLNRLQKMREELGLNSSKKIEKLQETIKKYHEYGEDAQGFVDYLRDNFSGEELTELALRYSRSANSVDEDGNLINQDVFIPAMLEGKISDSTFISLFMVYGLSQSDDKKARELKELFKKYKDKVLSAKLDFFTEKRSLVCNITSTIYEHTQEAKDAKEFEHLQEHGNLDHYYEVGQMVFSPKKEDGSLYSESEIEKIQSDIKGHTIQHAVDSIHILQEYDVDLNKKCFNGRSPLELLRVALDEGLLNDIDENSLYLLGLKKRPCETLNIGNIELNGLCDISLIVGRLENQARRNEKISKNYDLKLVEHVYGNTEGQCTITMFDKILSYKKEVFARDVEVYLNSSEQLGGTNNIDLTNFFEELKKSFPSKNNKNRHIE